LIFWRGEIPLFVWGRYEGGLKRAIAAMKYDRHPDLGRSMGRWIAESWRAAPPVSGKSYTLVPIPLYRERLRERGFNQAEEIALGFRSPTGYSLRADGLIRVRSTDALFGLSPEARARTMKAAFAVGRGLSRSVPILLVDDIYTTGTTIREAAKVLREGGYRVAGAIALASSRIN
jgi:ComF family protein